MIDSSSSPVPACPQCAQLLERIVELEALVRDLQERLNRNSSNSSIPPPANPLDAPKPVVKAPSGRKPGGQSGHPGRHRHRLPPERVKNIVPYVPTVRTQCRAPLPAEPGPGDPDPSRHQVAELPELAAVITEHPGHARTCPCCGYLLEQGRSRADSKAATSCVNLLALYPALWLFAAVEGSSPRTIMRNESRTWACRGGRTPSVAKVRRGAGSWSRC